MAEFAHLIEVRRRGGSTELVIDGQPFPWHIEDSGVMANVVRTNCPAVTVTILADRVTVDDALGSGEIVQTFEPTVADTSVEREGGPTVESWGQPKGGAT